LDDLTRLAGVSTPAVGFGEWNRFAPGTVLAGLFRLIAPLGRGGMGEVYRADDLKLDQQVALKFLPDSVAADPARFTQFHNDYSYGPPKGHSYRRS